MTDALTLLDPSAKKHVDLTANKRHVESAKLVLPSYFRGLCNFSGGLAETARASARKSSVPYASYFPSIVAFVAIV
jgi:hypothetical protein